MLLKSQVNFLLFCHIAFLILVGCVSKPPGKNGGVDLIGDKRPIHAIAVTDPDEIQILSQKYPIEIVGQSKGSLLFRAENDTLIALRNFGYESFDEEPGRVQRRVVRLLRQDRQAPDFETLGLTFINREDAYWVVSGDLIALRNLVRSGWSIEPLEDFEPWYRAIVVKLSSASDLEVLIRTGMEVWTAYPDDPARNDVAKKEFEGEFGTRSVIDIEATLQAREKLFLASEIIVEGQAFDYQIDQIEALGFSVERVRY
ncbi:MAG: hypothetical protein AAGK25_07575 [Pseudomonadota bacterium]